MSRLTGIYAAAPTPLGPDLELAADHIPALLDHLAGLGCHGALLLGTTGEGPSLSVGERAQVYRSAAAWRAARSEQSFELIAGTGCANLPETIEATRDAFAAGLDTVLLLPAFYYKMVTPRGLTEYFRRVVTAAVPPHGRFMVYHIPAVSGVAIPSETVADLAHEFPEQFIGLKDSGVDLPHTRKLIGQFPELSIFTGTDSHLAATLEAGGAGAITAMANVVGVVLRSIHDGHERGLDVTAPQQRLTAIREAALDLGLLVAVKALLPILYDLPPWTVRPPLEGATLGQARALARSIQGVLDE